MDAYTDRWGSGLRTLEYMAIVCNWIGDWRCRDMDIQNVLQTLNCRAIWIINPIFGEVLKLDLSIQEDSYMELDFLLNSLDKSDQPRNLLPCHECGVNPVMDCGYVHMDYWGNFDCLAPDTEDIFCEDCPHMLCLSCYKRKLKTTNE